MVSVIAPITPAVEWTKKILFSPLDMEKWFILGFSAFLAGLAQANLEMPFPVNPFGSQGGQEGFHEFDQAWQWCSEHLTFALGIGALVLFFVFAFGMLLQWLGSRGTFMFLDNVARNRAEVSRPWREFRDAANQFFFFRVLFGLASFLLIAAIAALCFYIARPDIVAGRFGASALLAVVTGVILFSTVLVTILTVLMVLVDFIAPIMYCRKVPLLEAMEIFRTGIIPGHTWALTLFYGMRFLFTLLFGTVMLMGGCLTCCVGFLPYVSSVIFLPLFVFLRCYSLFFLASFGDEWKTLVGSPIERP